MMNEIDDEHRSFPFPDYRKMYERDRQFRQLHIFAEIFPDFKNKEFKAREEIYLKAIYSDLNEINIDAKEISFSRIMFNSSETDFHYNGEVLRINFPSPVKKGDEIKLTIEYSARPRRGIFFISPDEYYPDKPYQLWTQGEDEDTRYWLPSYDYPNERTTTEFIVHVPKNYYVISNGKLVSREERENEIIYHYLEDFPHAIYLTSLAAGEFFVYDDEIDGIKLEYAVPLSKKDFVKRSFVNTPDMIRHFSRMFNFKYPYHKYSQVVVTDFMFGGMENINATTLTEYTLHDDRAHNDYMSEDLVAHELSHQWFGDFITCRDWSHAWLNEGFATYMNAVYIDHYLGYEDFLYQLYEDELSYKKEDSTNYRRPIVTNVYKYPGELFDRHLYEKASRVLHMLRNELGDDQFWNFINAYLNTSGGKSIDTHDLMNVLKVQTGRSWEQFFDQWIFHAGHPEFKVTYSYEKKTVKLKFEQVQKGPETPEAFSVTMNVAFYIKNERILKTLKINEKEEQFTFEMDEPDAISIDPDNTILKDLSFERPKKMLIQQLKLGWSIMEKIDAINNLKKESGQDVIDALKEAVTGENFYGVKVEALRALGEIGTKYSLDAMVSIGSKLIGNRDIDSRVRSAFAEALGKFFKEEKALEMLERIVENENKYMPVAKAFESIGSIRYEKSFDLLLKAKDMVSWADVIRRSMLTGFANLRDKRALDIAAQFLKLGYDQRLRAAAIYTIGILGEHDKDVLKILYSALKDDYFQVRTAAVNAIQNVGEVEAIPELEKAYYTEIDAHIKRSIRMAIEALQKGKKESDELKNLREEVEDLKRKIKELSEKVK